MKSKKSSLDFEQSKALVYLLCDIAKIPVPSIRLSEGVGYEGVYNRLEICLRRENTFETVVHEWLHYVFDLIFVCRISEKGQTDEDDDYEHRVILLLEGPLGRFAKKLYTRASKKLRGREK